MKLRGAGEMTFAPPPPISKTEKPRSFVPSGLNRKIPSAPLKPDGLVKTFGEKRCPPWERDNAIANDTAS